VEVALLTGGTDRHYAVGLAMALLSEGVRLDVIGSNEVDCPELHGTDGVNFLNLRGDQRQSASLFRKAVRVLRYYFRLIHYAAIAEPKLFHILWNNKFELFDRTLLMFYYKLLRKRVVLTAHNVNQARRDSTDSLMNRVTLRVQYRLADHIFVHTEIMKRELMIDFGVRESSITVIAYGINNAVPHTDLIREEAKQRLGIGAGERTMLFFGYIASYKGLDYLVSAFQQIVVRSNDYRLIIAGKPKRGCEKYWQLIQETIAQNIEQGLVIQKIEHIQDDEAELYFKAADVLILPYREIFQSGVLFFGYSFGLPVIATDVGAMREDIVEGKTGFVCKPGDPGDMARAIETYFSSDLYKDLDNRRQEIRKYALERHSWDVVGQLTMNVYAKLLRDRLSRWTRFVDFGHSGTLLL
jgi:glycosyltransferase involved in cell wall biosynthesis